ncbi:PG0541 family transporter-associated protein [Candidatus Chrysopegis kryptomonas]|jgi:nitrogen regulatory protein PII|uniref:Nitrogen regulatory protein P-II family n=1 Tax=Candidatus Chryseopegocella kryptomonas TaxID=1633643 RepID=A0A0P1MS85_9BACT|nr:PG0541 family transporter-associated protein [Candidatus Chrysopegis kryptomonas]CUS98615.1 nitrogen regulatory protein P-II family [Candidatus Chrysopegis kryptomonas]
MKLVILVFNQALEDEVLDVFEKLKIRGYTKLNDVYGQGSNNGEPHMGTHVWPEINTLILTVVEDEKVENLLNEVKILDRRFEDEGMHAFVLNVEKMI